jgi:hypothetical protein
MGNLAKGIARSKAKGDYTKVNLASIPDAFFNVFQSGNLTPTELSEMFGVKKRTIRKWKQTIREDVGFQKEVAMPDEIDIEDLVEERIKKFARKTVKKEAEKCFPIQVLKDGPIAIAHFGDPHVDDDGTNLGLLLKHAELVAKTDGMFGGNVGDVQNNWVGRLGRLYGEQSTSAAESWKLTEHFIKMVPWLYLCGGNHDAWSGAGDPLEYMIGQPTVYANHQVRLNLKFPNKKEIRVNCRHNFKGHSQYNTAHGISKAAMMGWRDHILTAGHTHVSGYQVLKDPMTGLISHAIRCASYKTYDKYAEQLGLADQSIFMCPVTIIDPKYDDNDPRLVTTIFDPYEGADYLTWKRSKKSA